MTPVTAIVVTYNSADEIVECVESLSAESDLEIYVIDNRSTDNTVSHLDELYRAGKINKYWKSESNIGFARAVNSGIAATENSDIILINPDARLGRNSLLYLSAAVENDDQIGLVAPIVSGPQGTKVISAGRQPRLWPMFTHAVGLSKLFPLVPSLRGRHLFLENHSREDQLVEWTSGCCLYIPRRTINKIGVLSERWFMYGEDLEYCKRATDAGLKVKLIADAKAFHSVGKSVNGDRVGPDTIINTIWATNTFDYYVHEFSPSALERLIWRILFSATLWSRVVLSMVKSKKIRPDDRAKRFFAYARAIW